MKIWREIRKKMGLAKENWIEDQCREMENNMRRNERKRVHEKVKKLMNAKQTQIISIKDKDGRSFTDLKDIINKLDGIQHGTLCS